MGWGLGRPLIHWKCYDFQASAWLRRWGGRQCSPSSHPILCRTKNTGVPRVCCDVSVRAISMLINTSIVTELTECWKIYGCPRGSWIFRGFSSRWSNFMQFRWSSLISHVFLNFLWISGFYWCAVRFHHFPWISITFTHFRCFSLICHCFLRLSVYFRRCSMISHGISLTSKKILIFFDVQRFSMKMLIPVWIPFFSKNF